MPFERVPAAIRAQGCAARMKPLLAFNGIQTQSARTCNLIHELDELAQLGVDVLSISPQSANTFETVKLFRQSLERSMTADLAARQLESLMPDGACNGYWHGRPGSSRLPQYTGLLRPDLAA